MRIRFSLTWDRLERGQIQNKWCVREAVFLYTPPQGPHLLYAAVKLITKFKTFMHQRYRVAKTVDDPPL